jgi:CelD/BcsL family acetyltransferase involved in cellulose biosynthesis
MLSLTSLFGARPRSELITSWEALRPLAADWDRLWQAGERSRPLCLAHGWVEAITARFDELRGTKTRPWCVVLRDGSGTVTGIAPLLLDASGQRARTLEDFVERNTCFLHTGPVEPLAREVLAQLDAAGIDQLWMRGILRTEARQLVDAWGGSWRCAATRMAEVTGNGTPGSCWWDRRSIVLRGTTWDEFLRARSGSYRSNLKRAWKKAEKEGTVRYWRHSAGRQLAGEPLSNDQLFQAIHQIEARAWQHEQHFTETGDGRVMLETLGALGLLDVSLLYLGDTPVSYTLGHASGRVATMKYLGFDPDYSHLSPGIVSMAELIRTTCEAGHLDEINLRGSEHQYKAQLADHVESAFELELTGRTARGLLSAVARRVRPRPSRALGREAQAAVNQAEAAPAA